MSWNDLQSISDDIESALSNPVMLGSDFQKIGS